MNSTPILDPLPSTTPTFDHPIGRGTEVLLRGRHRHARYRSSHSLVWIRRTMSGWRLSGLTFVLAVLLPIPLVGWEFSLGFTLLILAHEMGHWTVGRLLRVPVKPPVFIPMLGAFVSADFEEVGRWEQATVALAGPALGSAVAAPVLIVGISTHVTLLIWLGGVGLLLNALNCLPILPFDGGRAIAAVHPALWALGLGVVIWLEVIDIIGWPAIVMVALGLIVMMVEVGEWRVTQAAQQPCSMLQRLVIIGALVGVTAVPLILLDHFLPGFWIYVHIF